MTIDDKLDTINGKLDLLLAFIQNFTGPRIRPGDGSAPVKPADPPARSTGNPLLDAYARSNPLPAGSTTTVTVPDGIDRRSIRDLSDSQGPAIVEGPAGTSVNILCRRPMGSQVEITCGRVPSQFGSCTSAQLRVRDQNVDCRGSDCTGSLTFTASGADVFTVILNEAGGVEVHRSY